MQKVCLVAVLIFSFALPLTGAIRPWTKLSLDFAGPSTSETASPNPFTDYRMDVVFTGPTGATYRVPGYYAADGKAAETSTTSGNVWRVNFTPDAPGKWTYAVSFVKGSMIAAEPTGGESAGYFDGARGKFRVKKPDGRRGKLVYTGAHYLQFAGNGKYFLKSGTNSPEVFLEYNGFDNTPSDRTYPEHLSDWQPGDLTWQGGKGKGIVGAVNYLANQGVNAYYFLTMNAYGDGKKAWPWTHADSLLRYDCSKLAQWDLLFRYMNQKDLVLDLVLTETENEVYFEERELGGPEGFARSRKIYFREMVARFGYLPAVTWNVGEENGWHKDLPYQTANTDRQRKDYADYLRQLLYYDDHVTIHNGPSWDKRIFAPLYGHPSYTGPAFQWNLSKNIYREVYTLRAKSAAAGHKWVVFFDEPYLGKPRADLDDWRVANVWPAFMAGGAGVALYMGGGKDIKEQDFRPYAAHYRTMTIARKFFTEHISFAEMSPDSSFVEDAHTLRKGEATFLLYFPTYEGQDINLPPGKYTTKWFDPRLGKFLKPDQEITLNQDWVALIEKQDE